MSKTSVFIDAAESAPWNAVLATVPLDFKRATNAQGSLAVTGNSDEIGNLLKDGADQVLLDAPSLLSNQACGYLAAAAHSGKVFVASSTASNPTVHAWASKAAAVNWAAIHVGVRGVKEVNELFVSGLMLSHQILKNTPSDLRLVRTNNSGLLHSTSPNLTTTISVIRSERWREMISYVSASDCALHIEASDYENESTYTVVEHHREDSVITPTIFTSYRRQALLSLLTAEKASVVSLADFLEICISVNNAEATL